MDLLVVETEASLAKLSLAEAHLQDLREKGSAQAKRVEELKIGFGEAKAENEKTKAKADKSIAQYRADAVAVQTQLREDSNREQWHSDLSKCKSKRKPSRNNDLSKYRADAVVVQTQLREASNREQWRSDLSK